MAQDVGAMDRPNIGLGMRAVLYAMKRNVATVEMVAVIQRFAFQDLSDWRL
jgi:hypothetical protein